MIIKRLTMMNFGVYAGENSFIFSNKQPIVLIGGMNGRGKTTFLEAILLSLYGSNSFAFKESRFRSYGQYLRSYINADHKAEKCFVEIDIVMNESTGDEYQIRREWDAVSGKTEETITVLENGCKNEYLTLNWAMFVETILPSALSSFYFFDGEKIAELAVDDTDTQLKDSIRSMLGIGILDVLKSDLRRSLRLNSKAIDENGSVSELELLKDEIEKLEEESNGLTAKIDILNAQITKQQASLDELYTRYQVRGGDTLSQRQALMQKKADLQSEIENNHNDMIELAAGELPLLLVKRLLMDIKLQAQDERNDFIMKEAMGQIEKLLSSYSKEHSSEQQINQAFFNYVKDSTDANSTEKIYDVSEHALFQLSTLLETTLAEKREATLTCLTREQTMKSEFEKVAGYLSVDINEAELNKIKATIEKRNDQLIEMRTKLQKYEQARSAVEGSLRQKRVVHKRAVESYLAEQEIQDDSARMIKYSTIALDILESYTTELQKRKTKMLGMTITNCYKQLANKKNLIDRIEMDAQSLDLHYYNAFQVEVIKSALSAGEKQMMVIAILWALAICSKKKLPVIIDTPLSRLDSVHRSALVTAYFPKASDQTIILSTDSEIDRGYYDMMKEWVGDEFTLYYNDATRSTTVLKGYFNNDYQAGSSVTTSQGSVVQTEG